MLKQYEIQSKCFFGYNITKMPPHPQSFLNVAISTTLTDVINPIKFSKLMITLCINAYVNKGLNQINLKNSLLILRTSPQWRSAH